MLNGREWPRISIVTPNYNYGLFLEEAIRSVLLQNYPNLDYLVVDGGSTDGSLEILRKYERWLTWESGRDAGQSCAINKGLRIATGDIRAYLNSDDTYQPGALFKIASAIDPARHRHVVMGSVNQVSAHGHKVRVWTARSPKLRSLLFQYRLCRIGGIVVMPNQPSVFWHRDVQNAVGLFREDLRYAFDYEYWLRMLAKGFTFHNIHQTLSNYRFHDRSMSYGGWRPFYAEWKSVSDEYRGRLTLAEQRLTELYWWFVLVPQSLLTLPHRSISYACGVKRG
jgi:glycosyltransferase involved in cell wall biosynthesis